MSADNQQERPNYRFGYQVQYYCDKQCTNSMRLHADFFALTDEEAKRKAKEIFQRHRHEGESQERQSGGLDYTVTLPNFLCRMSEIDKKGRIGKQIDLGVNFYTKESSETLCQKS